MGGSTGRQKLGIALTVTPGSHAWQKHLPPMDLSSGERACMSLIEQPNQRRRRQTLNMDFVYASPLIATYHLEAQR